MTPRIADTPVLDPATEAPEPYRLEQQAGYLMRLATQRHTAIFAEMLPDLTPVQFSALVRLSEEESCSQNKLGRLIAVDAATIKGVIDRLREKGLVTSRADPEDRRRAMISLTPQGAALIPELHAVGATITARTLAPLGPDERATLTALLDKLR